jgi:hypothetical protein
VAPLAAASSPVARKLRVGVFAGGALQPRWMAQALAAAARSDFAEIVLLAIGRDAPSRRPLVRSVYDALDRRVFGSGPDPVEEVDLAQHVPAHRRMAIPEEGPQAAAAVLGLDVAFALGEIDDAQLEGIARLGVWRWVVDGAREVAAGAPLSHSALVVRPANGASPRIACQSWSRTYPLSVARNRDQLLAKTAEFACRALRDAQRGGTAWLERIRGQSPNSPRTTCEQNSGSDPEFPVGPILGRILKRGVEKALHVEQWFLAFRFDAEGELPSGDLRGYTRILPPRDRIWADPFVLEKEGRHYVFFEELPFAAGKAHISMIEVRRDGSYSAPVRVLERDYHLSYPFLVEDEGRLYMIPESAQNRTVEAWRCVDFPLQWRRERVLLDGVRLVDATFHREGERWWMFANAAAGTSRSFDDELHLFHAPRLLGDWTPHARNPVKSDARCARPAGALYRANGSLYRPAQICAPLYGSGLSLNRVTRLTPHEYAERQVARVLPSGGDLLGVHTLSRAGALTVVDAFTRRSRLA